MKRSTRSLALAPLLVAFASCETFTGVAPEGTPRVEVELAVIVGDDFLSQLVDPSADLVAAVKEAVRSEADLGLRFYPTLSERYGPNDRRPSYLMTVELKSLNVLFEQELIEPDGAPARLVTTIDEVGCSLSVALERRRGNAPPLTVATAKASERVGAETDPETIEMGKGYAPKFDGPTMKVLEADIRKAVERASHAALATMRKPIDREFAPQKEDEVPQADA